MNSKQRRKRRRLKHKLLFDHKKVGRGCYKYTWGGRKHEYFVEMKEDWIEAYVLTPQGQQQSVKFFLYLRFPKEISALPFLTHINDERFYYPNYILNGTEYVIAPNINGELEWHCDDIYHKVLFEEVFEAMTKKQKNQALWSLIALRGGEVE